MKCKSGEKCKNAPFHRQPETDEFLQNEAAAHFEVSRLELMEPPAEMPQPDAERFESKRADLIAARERLIELVIAGTWSLEVIDRKAKQIEADLMALANEERESTIQETDNTVENRNGARKWIEQAAGRWEKMELTQRRAVIAAMAEKIVVGREKIAIVWVDGAGMAARFVNGVLGDARGEVKEPKRHGRPAKKKADKGLVLGLDGANDSVE